MIGYLSSYPVGSLNFPTQSFDVTFLYHLQIAIRNIIIISYPGQSSMVFS